VSEIAQEIASQPACWARATRLAPRVAERLPSPGERVAALGCGTSFHIARGFAALREAIGQGETDAFSPSEFPLGRHYDRVVAISRSGTTTELVRLLEQANGFARGVVITGDNSAPLATLTTASIVLDFADERSIVQTRFATSALALLRAHLGEDLAAPIAQVEQVLGGPQYIDPTDFNHFVFLGHGMSVGLAEEAALKLRETAQAHAESYPAMEYRHGPISLAGKESLVWLLGSPDESIADDVAATGAAVRIGSFDPMVELVLIQRLAVALAETRGLDPDNPRHLTRSVVLTDVPAGHGGARGISK
jgi:fructoselysine-6-P-deglycase FrlB-like protein